MFKIGLHCEDKAVEDGEAGPAGNTSRVETLDLSGGTTHSGTTLIELVALPSFTHLSITIVNVPARARRKRHKYSFRLRAACLFRHNAPPLARALTIHPSNNYQRAANAARAFTGSNYPI